MFDHRFDPENCASSSRQELRETTEEIEFDEDRYMGDEYLGIEDDMMYLAAKEYVPFWRQGGEFREPVVLVEEGGGRPPSLQAEEVQSISPPPPPTVNANTSASASEEGVAFEWTEGEVSQLQKLPNKEYLMDAREEVTALSGFVSILIGYVYDVRMTCGDGSVESTWTIAKLSASLAWLENFGNPQDAVTSGVRRILCYP